MLKINLICISLTIFTALLAISNLAHAAPETIPSKLSIILQKQKEPTKLKEEADKVAAILEDKLKIKVTASVPLDYSAPVQALVSKTADIAYLDSVSYILAARDGGAEIILAEKRPDINGTIRTDYDSVFVVRKDSAISDFKDLLSRSKEIKIAFTSPTSTSGYLFPYKRLVEEGLLKAGDQVDTIFKQVSFAGSYTQALQEVVAKRADICAVSNYSIEGKAASTYLAESDLNQLKILERNPGVPTHVIVVRAGLDAKIKEEIKKAFLDISRDTPEIFTDVYGTASFTEVNSEQHTAATKKALEMLDITGSK